jgi:hypothetical protein
MTHSTRWFIALLALAAPVLPASAQNSVVIYHDGRILVRRIIPIAIPSGISRHRVEFDQFDPGSLVALDSGVTITDVQYPRVMNEQALYRASVGRRLLFQLDNARDTVSALVVGEDPPRFDMGNGQIRLTAPGEPLFPRELTGTARPTILVVESRRALPRLSLAYVSSGVTWKAEYAVVLSGATALVSGRMVLRSSDVRADSVAVSVLEGQVGRASDFVRQRGLQGFAAGQSSPNRLEEVIVTGVDESFEAVPAMVAPPVPLGVGGFRVYGVPGRHSLVPGHITVGPLFDPLTVPAVRVHVVSGQGGMQGIPEQALAVELQYRLTRPRETAFGANAIPPGLARLYGRLPDGDALLVGEAIVSRADAGKVLELRAGNALDVTARRLPVRISTVQDSMIGADGRIQAIPTGQILNAEIRFTNASDSLAVIEMTERIPAQSRLVSSSVPGETTSPGAVLFRIRVPARGDATLTYRLRLTP